MKLWTSWTAANKNRFWLITAVLTGVVLITLPLFIESDYIKHLLIMSFIGAALGITFSLLYNSGLISLGAAAFYTIGAYISAMLAIKLGLSFWITLPLTVLISTILALGCGAMFVRNGGVAFVIITLLFAQVVVLAAGEIEFLGGWGGIIGIPVPTALGPVQFTGKTPFYYLILAILLLIALTYYALYNSRIGRAWKAIKLSPNLAGTLGVNLYNYRLLAFVISSVTAAAVGSFYAHYSQTITPSSFGGWLSIYIQLYAVLGGLEFYLLGPTVGAIIMTFVPEYLRIAKEIEPIITGILLLIIILFLPGGILGTIKNFPKMNLQSLETRINEIKGFFKSNK